MDNNNSSLNFIPRNEIHFSENQFRFDEQRVSIRSKFRLFSIIISTSMEFRERIISGLFFPWVRLNYYIRFELTHKIQKREERNVIVTMGEAVCVDPPSR